MLASNSGWAANPVVADPSGEVGGTTTSADARGPARPAARPATFARDPLPSRYTRDAPPPPSGPPPGYDLIPPTPPPPTDDSSPTPTPAPSALTAPSAPAAPAGYDLPRLVLPTLPRWHADPGRPGWIWYGRDEGPVERWAYEGR